MIDVLFIEPDSSSQAYQDLAKTYAAIETPTWSLLLAQSCRSKGYSVNILDANAERLGDEESTKRIATENPRIACFVVYGQNPNSGTTNMSGALSLAKRLKIECPHIKICFVGSHSSALPEEVIENSFVDIVLTNEGVYALHDLLESDLEKPLHHVKGIAWKPETGSWVFNEAGKLVPQERMDIDLPGYAWDLLPYNEKPLDLYRAHFWHAEYDLDNRTPFAAIYTSLGCRFKCDFCMINILNRNSHDNDKVSSDFAGMRWWSSELVLKEFDKLQEMGVKNVRISDEMFFLNKKHYYPIVQNLAEREYKFNMWAYSRIDTCRKEYLSLFKKAGINWLALGIEAASPTVRKEITKGKFEDVKIQEVIATIREADINVGGNFIFGFPNEKMEDLQATLDLAFDLKCEFTNMYCAAALPGSPLYRQAVQNGWDLPTTPEGYAFYAYDFKPLPTNHLKPEEVIEFRDKAWNKLMTDPDYLDAIEDRFGKVARESLIEQTKIKLKRRILENESQ